MRASDAELLEAYLDGVTELTTAERRRVEAQLASDPSLRADLAATRELLGNLRELPPVGGQPDWNALERSIADTVGTAVPKPWWRRWQWVVPGIGLATIAAIVLVVMPTPAESEIGPELPSAAPVLGEPRDTTVALYVDGIGIEIEADADDLIEDPLARLRPGDGVDPADVASDLMSPSDLAWVDELDEDALARIEGYLERKRT